MAKKWWQYALELSNTMSYGGLPFFTGEELDL